MFLAAATVIASVAVAPPHGWRCYKEVYDLSLYKGKIVAATSGGVLVEATDHRWTPLGPNCPAPLRKLLVSPAGSLSAIDRNGLVYGFGETGGVWFRKDKLDQVEASSLPSPTARYNGHVLRSNWGSRSIVDERGISLIPRDPAEGDYALLAVRDRLLAGTPQGIYEYADGEWKSTSLPVGLPVLRPQGIGFGRTSTVVGGLEGVFLKDSKSKNPGWIRVSNEPVRQMLQSGPDVWILHGSGAVDKLDLDTGRLYFDALHEGSKRPWTSCIAKFDDSIVFGSQGGWVDRIKQEFSDHFWPDINAEIITAVAGKGETRWIGTQGAGLLRYGQGAPVTWNPGNGLPDTWVTALLHSKEGLYAATSGAGLFLLKGDTIRPVDSPTQRPRQLALYRGALVVGGMDGAWIKDGASWTPLPTNGEETTAIVAGTRLVICTASGVYFL